MRTSIEAKGFDELQKDVERMSKEDEVKIKNDVFATALEVQFQAKDNLQAQGAIDKAHLENSIIVDVVDGGMGAEIGPTAGYGPYVEHGTRPHFPPPDALEDWARSHGFDSAWPICKIIAERGLRARPYLLPAYLSKVNEFFERIRRIFQR